MQTKTFTFLVSTSQRPIYLDRLWNEEPKSSFSSSVLAVLHPLSWHHDPSRGEKDNFSLSNSHAPLLWASLFVVLGPWFSIKASTISVTSPLRLGVVLFWVSDSYFLHHLEKPNHLASLTSCILIVLMKLRPLIYRYMNLLIFLIFVVVVHWYC